MRFHDSPPVIKSKKLSTKLFGLCSDESIISHRMILNRYLLFCVYFALTFEQVLTILRLRIILRLLFIFLLFREFQHYSIRSILANSPSYNHPYFIWITIAFLWIFAWIGIDLSLSKQPQLERLKLLKHCLLASIRLVVWFDFTKKYHICIRNIMVS